MKLSVIIVNYNVEYFLEQCLLSVEKAMRHVSGEVWVIDNNSVDGSVAMVEQKFPWVKLIANKDNPGFSKGNNQAIRQSAGEYVLLLNPDTLVEEDTFVQVVHFMDQRKSCGGLGVKMVDGRGIFLPESKRGLPTPRVSLFKMIGLTRIFPKSSLFACYYLGHLDKNQIHEIEVLSGAFMLMRKEALDQVGLLDEDFFMYGEDIDLSYRLILGGWKNYYYPKTQIIHYKGESTKKGSLNYVFVFYNAMVIFVKKHFGAKKARLFGALINIAIYVRAAIAIVTRLLARLALPLLEGAAIAAGVFAIRKWYETYSGIPYENSLVNRAAIGLGLLWAVVFELRGAYRRKQKRYALVKSIGLAAAVSLIIYALLPESVRFSRAIVAGSVLWAGSIVLIIRGLGQWLAPKRFPSAQNKLRNIAIVGSKGETDRIQNLLRTTSLATARVSHISTGASEDPRFVAHIDALEEVIRIYQISDVIFCAADVSTSRIIQSMSEMESHDCEFKIAPASSDYIIGSQSVAVGGDFLLKDINSIAQASNKSKKRAVDFLMASLLLLLFPFTWLAQRKGTHLFQNLVGCLVGKYTFVGYHQTVQQSSLPALLPSLLSVNGSHASHLSEQAKEKLNTVYARDYRARNDLKVIAANLRSLGKVKLV